jgi:peptide/nickel transport system substrate-binding protein/nickel transport system substrate-binding protein
MKKFVIMILCCILVAAFSGCGKQEQLKSSGSAETPTVLNIGFGGSLENYTPANAYGINFTPVNLVYETLVKYDNGEIVPYLAESWEWNDSMTEITFHLRDDVIYHDGIELTAETVKKNFEWLQSNMMYTYLKGVHLIKSIEVVETHTIKFIYDNPYYAVLQDLSSANPSAMVSPETLSMDDFEVIHGSVGTGPYIYEAYDSEIGLTLKANENYWGAKPTYDAIVLHFIPDSNARFMALEKGEIDMVYGADFISCDDYVQAKSNNDIKGSIAEQTTKTRNVLLNAASPNLSDIRVREAILHTIDNESIVESLMYGYEDAAEGIFDSKLPHCDVEISNVRQLDIAKAKTLLDEAGWSEVGTDGIRIKNGERLTLRFIYQIERSLLKDITEVVKEQLKEVGIEVQTEGLEMMSWFQRGGMGDFDMSVVSTYAMPNDPHNYLAPMIIPESPGDYVSLSSLEDYSRFEELVQTTLITGDGLEIDKLYAEILNYLNDNAIYVPLSYQKEMVLYRVDKIDNIDFGGCSINLNPECIHPVS